MKTRRTFVRPRGRVVMACLACLAAAACIDILSFAGTYSGFDTPLTLTGGFGAYTVGYETDPVFWCPPPCGSSMCCYYLKFNGGVATATGDQITMSIIALVSTDPSGVFVPLGAAQITGTGVDSNGNNVVDTIQGEFSLEGFPSGPVTLTNQDG